MSKSATLMLILVLAAFLIFGTTAIIRPSTGAAAPITAPTTTAITVHTTKLSYTTTDDAVKVSGYVQTTNLTGKPLVIKVTNPEGKLFRYDQVNVGTSGNYSYAFKIGGRLGISGQYNVAVSYDNATAHTSFHFTASPELEPPHWKVAKLHIGSNTYDLLYYITHGSSLKGLTGNYSDATITANIDATADGKLVLQIPRNIADAKNQDGTDNDFVVFVDQIETLSADDSHGKDTRTLVIPFAAKSRQIDIAGIFVAGSAASVQNDAQRNPDTQKVANPEVQCKYVGPVYVTPDSSYPPIVYPSHKGVQIDFKVMPDASASSAVKKSAEGLSLKLALIDTGTNQALRYVIYGLTISRTNASGLEETVLSQNYFRSISGNLTLDLRPAEKAASPSSGQVIHAEKDLSVPDVWWADPAVDKITIDNVTLKSGKYHAHIDMLGMDSGLCLFEDKDMPRFDNYWTLRPNDEVSR